MWISPIDKDDRLIAGIDDLYVVKRNTVGEVDDIGALDEVLDGVCPCPHNESIGAFVANKGVIADVASEAIATVAAEEDIVALTAIEAVVPIIAAEGVIAPLSKQHIVAGAAA